MPKKPMIIQPGQFIEPPGASYIKTGEEAWERGVSEHLVYAKYEGWRIQVHVWQGLIALYSRKGNDYLDRYEDTARQILSQVGDDEVVLDVELVAYSSNGRALSSRMLKQARHRKCWILDVLYLSGKDLTRQKTVDRYNALLTWIKEHPGEVLVPVEMHHFKEYDDWNEYYSGRLQLGFEGVILKGKENGYFEKVFKVKKNEPIDAIVVAGFRDPSSEGDFKKLLLAIPSTKTGRLATIGTVDRDEGENRSWWEGIMNAIKEHECQERPPEMKNIPILPTVWFAPKIVLEIEGHVDERMDVDPEYTLGGYGGPGYRLQDILIKRIRDEEKGPEHATTEDQVIELLELPPQFSGRTVALLGNWGAERSIVEGNILISNGRIWQGDNEQVHTVLVREGQTRPRVVPFSPQELDTIVDIKGQKVALVGEWGTFRHAAEQLISRSNGFACSVEATDIQAILVPKGGYLPRVVMYEPRDSTTPTNIQQTLF